jgi:hypothetical protein
MKQIKDLREKDVILCTTQSECEAIAELLDTRNNSYYWQQDKPYKDKYIGNFCYNVFNNTFAPLFYYESEGFTIHLAKDFIKQISKEKDKFHLDLSIQNIWLIIDSDGQRYYAGRDKELAISIIKRLNQCYNAKIKQNNINQLSINWNTHETWESPKWEVFNFGEKPSKVKQELKSIISEWHESKFQKQLIEIIRERLNEVK